MASSEAVSEVMRGAGEISATPDIHYATLFEWRIPHVNTVLQKKGDSCESPPFEFCNTMWTLKLTRNRRSSDIHLIRVAKAPSHEFFMKCTVVKKATYTSLYFTQEGSTAVGNIRNIFVFCAQNFEWSDERDYEVIISCPFECRSCRSVASAAPSNSLGEDLLELLISGEESDVTINVKQREFRVHKSIIRARSPVFSSMLKNEMAEKRSGTIDIPDCDPEAFKTFLEYVYSGELKITKDVVCNVYYIADKYQVLNVKNLCVKFMSENLSLETFCDISFLAIRHEESDLLEKAKKFYADNMEAITESDRWNTFLEEHPVAANDVFIKLQKPKFFHEKKRKQESAASKDEIHKYKLDTVIYDMDEVNDLLAEAAAKYNQSAAKSA